VLSTDTNIICNSDITLLTSSDAYLSFVLCVNDIKDFLGAAIQRLKNDEMRGWLVYLYNVYYFVVVYNLKGEKLLAEFTVQFLKFDNHLSSMNLHGSFCFKPLLKAFKMNSLD
jgi:hypothetical protein